MSQTTELVKQINREGERMCLAIPGKVLNIQGEDFARVAGELWRDYQRGEPRLPS